MEKGSGGQGPRRQANERWIGDIKKKIAGRKTGQVHHAGSRLPLRVTTLDSEIRK